VRPKIPSTTLMLRIYGTRGKTAEISIDSRYMIISMRSNSNSYLLLLLLINKILPEYATGKSLQKHHHPFLQW
jgi:hypothetical protein